MSGILDSTDFAEKMLTILTPDVFFHSSYVPVNQSLAPLFQDRQGFEEILSLYEYKRDFTNITSISNPDDIATGPANAVLYYHQTHVGSFGEGVEVSWETSCKLSFNATEGKIMEILLSVVDSELINQAYPTSL